VNTLKRSVAKLTLVFTTNDATTNAVNGTQSTHHGNNEAKQLKEGM